MTETTTGFHRELARVRSHETDAMTDAPRSLTLVAERLVPQRPNGWAAIYMHPTGLLSGHQLPAALARAGFDTLCCGTRFLKNGTTLHMEQVAFDVSSAVAHAYDVMGAERVALVGWSGGASISAMAQAEATHPTVEALHGGARYELARAGLREADALVHVAGHRSRAHVLQEWLDPSVLDDDHPSVRDRDLYIYGEDAPEAPFSEAFMRRYRGAQAERLEVLSRRALERSRRFGDRPFIMYGTAADPRFFDLALDPNGRRVGFGLGDAKTLNDAPSGMGRFTSCHSFLSQWSPRHTRADGWSALARCEVPYLVLENGADDACPREHVLGYAERGGVDAHVIEGANHFFSGQPELADRAAAAVDAFTRGI